MQFIVLTQPQEKAENKQNFNAIHYDNSLVPVISNGHLKNVISKCVFINI